MATISGDEYTTIMNERKELQEKLEAAASESLFLASHYTRLLRACETSYEQATRANIVLERKQRRETVKEQREALKAKLKAEKTS